MKIAVIGGGAAGMAAAIAAAKQGAEVAVLEQGERVGRKLLSTGNGRCNFTNLSAGDPAHYKTGDEAALAAVLSACPPARVRAFLEEMGVPSVVEEGRVYPRPFQAAAVVDALRMTMAEWGVEERCGARAEAILKKSGGFLVRLASKPGEREKALWADRVVVTAGGKAAPKLSGGGDYGLLTALGHSCTALLPALCQLRTETGPIRALKGIRVQAALRAFAGKTLLREDVGEVLFTEYGLSGIPALQLSLFVGEVKTVRIEIDFFPELDESALFAALCRRAEAFSNRTLSEFFVGMLPKRVGEALWKRAKQPSLEQAAGALEREALRAVAAQAKAFSLRLEGVQPFESAQVTAGGVPLCEFDERTMESRRVPGLFAAGEVLDAAGECGGFNLHWAFASGWIAGTSAGQE